jgi:peroxiredoxin Q/BCP
VQLADYRGRSVLLYFQEGLGCQPCWEQLRDLEARRPDLRAAGIDEILTVTTDPVDQLRQKAADEGLKTPVLSDPDLAVSRAYETNSYGMMGDSRNGHTFLLVAPDGTITWRADYGGAPKYTMFLPVDRVLADLKAATA